MKKDLLTVKELAAELRMSPKSIQRAYQIARNHPAFQGSSEFWVLSCLGCGHARLAGRGGWFIWFVLFVWLGRTGNQINQMNQMNKSDERDWREAGDGLFGSSG
jgi:hypothetical protein